MDKEPVGPTGASSDFSFRHRFITNISWSALAVILRVLIAAGALAMLGRLVDPVTMGIYGLAWGGVALGYTVSQTGAAQGIIAMPEVKGQHLAAGHALAAALSVAVAVLLIVASPLVEAFYGLDGLAAAFSIGGLFVPAMCLPAVDIAVAQKELAFGRLAFVQTVAAGLSAVTAVGLAWIGHGLLGLFALQGGVGPFAFLLFRAVRQPLHLQPFAWRHVTDVWRIGGHLSLNSLTVVLLQNLPQIVLGRFVSATALGYFAYSSRIIQLIGTQLMGMVNTVIYPTFASIRSELLRVGRAYLTTARYTAFIVFFPLLVLVVAPAPFLQLYGGQEWVRAGDVLLFLAIMQMFFALGSNVFPTFLAIGRPSAAWKWNLFLSSFQGVAVLLLGRHGVVAAAQGLAVTGVVWPLAALWLSRVVGFAFSDYLRNMLAALIPVLPAVATGLLVAGPAREMGTSLAFLLPAGVAATVCLGLAILLDPRLRGHLIGLARGRPRAAA